jgi:DNA-binding MarR family transcriptional regulator
MTKTDKKKGLDLGVLPSLIGYHVRLAQIEVFEDFAQTLSQFDLSPGRFGVLVLIEANPGLNQGQLAAASRLDRSTMVSVIDYLEGRGLVVRKPSPTDRRTNALWLTPKGKVLVGQMKQLIAQHEERVLADLSAAERATLIELLGRIKGQKKA